MKVSEAIAGQRLIIARVDQQLGDVSKLMERHRLSGIPIVDEQGAFVGLVTLATLLRQAHDGKIPLATHPDSDWSPSQQWTETAGPWQHAPVREVMVTDVKTVDSEMDVVEAGRAMVTHGVHRMVVLGPDRKVSGVLSALDFVTLVADGRLARDAARIPRQA